MTFAWAEERRHEYPVAALYRVLGVSRSGFYARAKRPPSAAATRRAGLAARIGEVHAEAKARYGSPRVHAELSARGVACCVDTVAKLMRAGGLRAKASRRLVRTTDSRHGLAVAPNALGRDFAPAGPDEKWCADFTDVPTLEGWLFLAVEVDLFGRRIVLGGAKSATVTSRLVVDALGAAAPGGGAGGALGPRQPVRQRPLPLGAGPARVEVQHERGRAVRGQRRGREHLRPAQARAGPPRAARHPRRGQGVDL